MMLLLDIGNTRIKWGTLERGALTPRGAVAHGGGAEAPIRGILDAHARPDAVWIANVGGAALAAAVTGQCGSRWGLVPRFATAVRETSGVRNGYDDAGRLGVDRWLAMLAAYARARGPSCVVNCGTAVTIDMIDADGAHRGGFVIPGMELMARSLADGTDAIRIAVDARPTDGPGRSTRECVINGAGTAIAALLDRAMERFARDCGAPVHGIASGGGAAALLPLVRHAFEHDPDLVLRGLALVAEVG